MTYEKLWLKATYLLDHNKIKLGEFEEMIKPLKKEIPQDCENCADYSPKFDTCQRKEHECTFKPKFMPKDEPQTDCGDFADRLAYERGVKHAWEVAQKVFDSTVTFYEAEDVAKQIDKDINVRSKWETPPKFEHKGVITTCVSVPMALVEDEPQTDCAWKKGE